MQILLVVHVHSDITNDKSWIFFSKYMLCATKIVLCDVIVCTLSSRRTVIFSYSKMCPTIVFQVLLAQCSIHSDRCDKICAEVEVEEHTECGCECKIKPHHCNEKQVRLITLHRQQPLKNPFLQKLWDKHQQKIHILFEYWRKLWAPFLTFWNQGGKNGVLRIKFDTNETQPNVSN